MLRQTDGSKCCRGLGEAETFCLGVMAHASNPSTWEAEVEGLPQFEVSLGYTMMPCLKTMSMVKLKQTKGLDRRLFCKMLGFC